MAKLHPTRYSIEVPSTYVHEGAGTGKPLLIAVHGFADSAPSFLRRALPQLPGAFEVLAPNGPFPLPQRVEGEWKEAYGWYFADLSARKIHVHPEVAAGAVGGLVRALGLADRPKVLLGFSQGGYFLPHLARELREVRAFVAVGAGFHPEFFRDFGLSQPVWWIHGRRDEVIPFDEAARDYAGLPAPQRAGAIEIAEMGHTIDEDGRREIAGVLRGLGEV